MKKAFLLWAGIFGLVAVVLGAIGAHALKDVLSDSQLSSFETGVRYQMYHALLLLVLSNIKALQSKAILWLIVLGVFLFSFSIYLLNLLFELSLEGLSILGPITPIGGILLITAWGSIIYKSLKIKSE
ncbi:MAG: hypothetical protein CMC96_08975 [Flavobacteriales bacterium]|mgnify:CR=1|nr:hypothetical protein [Flavobacteriales bacterium]|tara:strand:- start:19052 stop:19435 length:384 start_codon:yes stop_codon:yes gene_type:complete